MEKKYAVDINNRIITWKDGKFECDDSEMLSKLEDACKEAEKKEYIQIELDGSLIYAGRGVNPEPSWAASFGFLQQLSDGRLTFVTGDRPTWKKLGHEEKENEIY